MAYKKIAVFKNECSWYPVCPMKHFTNKADRTKIGLNCIAKATTFLAFH
jgi:hypothetical protein